MDNPARLLIVVATCLFSSIAAYAENEEAEARRIAEAAIKIGAIDYLTDRDFKLDGPKIKVTARAIEPKENVKVEIKDFKLLPNSVDLKFSITAPFRFEGRLISDDTERDVRGKGEIGQLISLEAKYWLENRRLQVDAKATDIEFSGKVEELTPEGAGGGKSAFEDDRQAVAPAKGRAASRLQSMATGVPAKESIAVLLVLVLSLLQPPP